MANIRFFKRIFCPRMFSKTVILTVLNFSEMIDLEYEKKIKG